MSSANLDAADLAGVSFNGLIHESVMDRIWDISRIPLPLADRIGSDTNLDNSYHEWTIDALGAVDVTNATIDGADAGADESATGSRVGNHCQIPDKVVKVSDRARNSKTIGFSDTLAYQVMMRQQELRRDVDAIALEPQASFADTGAAAGKMGGLPSWLETNTSRGATGTDGGFSAGIVAAPGNGTIRALTETLIRDMAQAVYVAGGNPTLLMSTPNVLRKLSTFMFSSSANIATLQRNEQGMGAGTAVGSVNVFITDFGVTLEFVPNRLQQEYNGGTATNVFLIDPAYVAFGYLQGYQVKPLSRQGTAEQRQMTVDVTLIVMNEAAHAVIADIDDSLAVTA